MKHPVPVIVLAFSNPNDSRSRHRFLRNIEAERKAIEDALRDFKYQGLCEVEVLPHATADDIYKVFNDSHLQGRIAVFHFGGHSDGYSLLLESDKGGQRTYKKGLAAFLGEQPGLQCVFLNGCASQGHAEELKKHGIPLTIATSQAINDKVAKEVAEQFYRALGLGRSVRQAWKQAEAVAKSRGKDGIYSTFYHDKVGFIDKRYPWTLLQGAGILKGLNWNIPEAAANPLVGLPDVPEMAYLPSNPFPELAGFKPDQGELFFGRDAEIRQLYFLITEPLEKVTVLFGQSGVGKTSLLNAGLVPRLGSIRAVTERWAPDIGYAQFSAHDVPEQTNEKLEPQDHPDQIHTVYILDQFEAAFTQSDISQDSSAHPENILQKIKSLKNSPGVHILICIRNDFSSRLFDDLDKTRINCQRMFLQPLNENGIRNALMRLSNAPRLQSKYRLSVEDGFVSALSKRLTLDPNSPVAPMLSIILHRLYQSADNRKAVVFKPSLLESAFPENQNIMTYYFNRQMEKLGNDPKTKEAVDSGLILNLLYDHVSPTGTSAILSESSILARYSHISKKVKHFLEVLRNSSRLLTTPEDPDPDSDSDSDQPTPDPSDPEPESFSSLIHDSLIPALQSAFQRSKAPGQQARRILDLIVLDSSSQIKSESREQVKKEKGRHNKKEVKELDKNEIKEIEKGIQAMTKLSPDEDKLWSDNKAAYLIKRRNRLIFSGVKIASILTMIILGTLIGDTYLLLFVVMIILAYI